MEKGIRTVYKVVYDRATDYPHNLVSANYGFLAGLECCYSLYERTLPRYGTYLYAFKTLKDAASFEYLQANPLHHIYEAHAEVVPVEPWIGTVNDPQFYWQKKHEEFRNTPPKGTVFCGWIELEREMNQLEINGAYWGIKYKDLSAI